MASLSEKMAQAGYQPNNGSLLSQMSSAGHTPLNPPSRNLGDYTADAYVDSGRKIVESVTRAADRYNPNDGSAMGVVKNVGALGEGLLGAASGAVQGFFAPVSGALGKLGEFLPKRTAGFDAAYEQAQASGMVASPSNNVVTGPQPNAFNQFAEAHPDAARNLTDAFVVGTTALGGASGLLGRTAAETTVGEGLAATRNAIVSGAKGTLQAVKSPITTVKSLLPTPSEAQIESAILKTYEKGVKPNLPGKTTPSQLADYRDDVVTAVRTIKQNQSNLRYADDAADGIVDTIKGQTPKNLQQLTEAVEQTKSAVFAKYDALAQQAGKAGVAVKTASIANELDMVINNRALALTNPRAIQYARQLKDRLARTGDLDASTAQEVIQNYNKSLEAFYRNPTYDAASQAAIDALIANRFRTALDEGITGLTGESYKALKAQYGALKAIERDVIKATLRDARKNIKGLIDFTDIFSGGQVVTGLLTLNPAVISTGLAQKAIATFYKYLNNPNRAIERMFKAVDKLPQADARLKIQAPIKQSAKIDNAVIPGKVPQGAKSSNKANVDAKAANPTKAAWPTTASKPSKAGSTSTGNAPTGKGGVSAQRAGTSGPFEGDILSAEARKYDNGFDFAKAFQKKYGSDVRIAKLSDIEIIEPKLYDEPLAKYRKAFAEGKGDEFIPIVGDGTKTPYRAVDGNHRLQVLKENGVEYVPVRLDNKGGGASTKNLQTPEEFAINNFSEFYNRPKPSPSIPKELEPRVQIDDESRYTFKHLDNMPTNRRITGDTLKVNGKVVGGIEYGGGDNGSAFIEYIEILPEYRAKGYATEVVAQLISESEGKQLTGLATPSSRAFWKRLGATIDDEDNFVLTEAQLNKVRANK